MPRGGWRGGGRPKGSKSRKPTRTVVKQVRWTREEWAEVERASKDFDMTCSEYIRLRVLG